MTPGTVPAKLRVGEFEAIALDGAKEPANDQWQQYAEVLLASNELMFVD